MSNTSSGFVDAEPGGESTQYESIPPNADQVPKASSESHFAATTDQTSGSADTTGDALAQEKGERKAENIRYGQNVSESGMGGFTTSVDSNTEEGRSSRTDESAEKATQEARSAQGYDRGDGEGAEVGG